jgi:hypothetical protein
MRVLVEEHGFPRVAQHAELQPLVEAVRTSGTLFFLGDHRLWSNLDAQRHCCIQDESD